ncbi:hypothetical protein [Achromobacter sp. MFA1 R4]|uniref:hypothetical protein n=1 Tax=Achromobacter sp. MFA1 R4 TaxID=1881016 RepID=UPI0009539149|nr:hypothetical protein [Achromobacter sp. MFA1 R4]SIT25273.1 hypothetical protein SAMN05428937_2986 [Achromobacter sp. MFA1 R4]
MSKRYGRNQKRRARERIAQLESAYAREQQLLAHIRGDLRSAEDVIDHARSVLGHDVALPPVMRGNHPHPLGGDFVMAVPCRIDEPMPLTLDMKVIQMRQLLAGLEYQDYRPALHFYVKLDDGHAAYVIDERDFAQMHRDELAATLHGPIAKALARLLADHLKGR